MPIGSALLITTEANNAITLNGVRVLVCVARSQKEMRSLLCRISAFVSLLGWFAGRWQRRVCHELPSVIEGRTRAVERPARQFLGMTSWGNPHFR